MKTKILFQSISLINIVSYNYLQTSEFHASYWPKTHPSDHFEQLFFYLFSLLCRKVFVHSIDNRLLNLKVMRLLKEIFTKYQQHESDYMIWIKIVDVIYYYKTIKYFFNHCVLIHIIQGYFYEGVPHFNPFFGTLVHMETMVYFPIHFHWF